MAGYGFKDEGDDGDGWKMKVYSNKIILGLLAFSMLWTISLFIAPSTLEPGTVVDLQGTAVMDFEDQWAKMDVYHHFVYAFGDSQCHQKSERSFSINGNQMPLCARCMSLFMWANIGVVTAMLLRPDRNVSETGIKILPKRWQEAIKRRNKALLVWVLICILTILPTAMDGFTQLFTDYQSNNLNRVLFSLPTGWFGGFALGLMLNNIHYNIKLIDEERAQKGVQTQTPVEESAPAKGAGEEE